MYGYVTNDLMKAVESFNTADMSRKSIMGHSMGGMGSLNLALKDQNPCNFKSCSAFAPISNPSFISDADKSKQWGYTAFTHYLGDDESTWKAWDPCENLKKFEKSLPMKITTGTVHH